MRRVRLALFVLAAAVVVIAGLAPAAPPANAGPGVIVCSCKLCAQNPYVECQIGPGDGYSILCADYFNLNC